VVLLCVFLLSGCRVLQGSGSGGDDPQSTNPVPQEPEGDDPGGTDPEGTDPGGTDPGGTDPEGTDPEGTDPVPQEPVWNGDPVAGAESIPNIKEKFGAETVAEAFHELSAFISNGGLDANPPVIHTGDWIDLAALSVESYNDTGGFSATNSSALRLIVVGINSFRKGRGYSNRYTVTKNDGVDHVVFQFQNLPVKRRMNPSPDTNAGGYAASEMRRYLVKVNGVGGNFLTGLIKAGVPEDVLWAPVRYVANGGSTVTNVDEINDFLWLPTEGEMVGSALDEARPKTYETHQNQARLEYYAGNDQRPKYFGSSQEYYWEASPVAASASSFCTISKAGRVTAAGTGASGAWGVAPAFCVR
jgi:hypothetical protein